MENFILVLGQESQYLPGKLWSQYEVEVLDDKMVCVSKQDRDERVEINYNEFVSATFGIGNGNLWLRCQLKQGSLIFCSPRKCWKSSLGKKLIEKINSVVEIEDMKEYKHYTGRLFFIYMFK